MRLSRLTATVVAGLAVALTGCAEGDAVQQQAVTGQDGIQATGRVDGKRVALTTGSPTVVYGDCDPNDGLDVDLCVLGRTIDGVRINLVIENPDEMVVGEAVSVTRETCQGPDCDDVTGGLVVDLRVDGDEIRVESGTVTATAIGERSAAAFTLRFSGGDLLSGSFDVATPNRPER